MLTGPAKNITEFFNITFYNIHVLHYIQTTDSLININNNIY